MNKRDRLAVLGGFVRPAASAPYGTQHASYDLCRAIADSGRFRGIDIFHENAQRMVDRGEVERPAVPSSAVLERSTLPGLGERYQACYVANGEQMQYAPHFMRPAGDALPMICEIGTTHNRSQWLNFMIAHHYGAIHSHDGLIIKSRRALRLFEEAWTEWSRFVNRPMPLTVAIPNGIDPERNRRIDSARASLRQRLGIPPDRVVFLVFNRLSPGTKGDQHALVALWREVRRSAPDAFLIIAGAVVDREYLSDLRTTARRAEVSDHCAIVDNPFEVWPEGRRWLMSAADVFVHVSTGAEETTALVILEAMAHGLPVIAADWCGFGDVVSDGRTGWLVPTLAAPVPSTSYGGFFGASAPKHVSDLARSVCVNRASLHKAILEAARSRETRAARSHAARVATETVFSLRAVTARRLDLTDELAERAQRVEIDEATRNAWIRTSYLDRVVTFNATAALDGRDRFAVSDLGALELVAHSCSWLPKLLLDEAARLLANRAEYGVDELTALLAHALESAAGLLEPSGDIPDETRAVTRRLLLQLESHGVIRFAERTDRGYDRLGVART